MSKRSNDAGEVESKRLCQESDMLTLLSGDKPDNIYGICYRDYEETQVLDIYFNDKAKAEEFLTLAKARDTRHPERYEILCFYKADSFDLKKACEFLISNPPPREEKKE